MPLTSEVPPAKRVHVALEQPPGRDATADREVVIRLLLGSSLMLFLELALIRWLGSNIVHLSYFSNFVLLGSFLGIGAGFLISRRSWSVLHLSPVILVALVVWVWQFPVVINGTGEGIVYFTSVSLSGPPVWLALPLVFVASAAILAGPAEVVGRCFGQLQPLTAYRWDLIGSLAGIVAFTTLSFLGAPSVVWASMVMLAFLCLLAGWKRMVAAACCSVVVGALYVESTFPGISWSPYYRIMTSDAGTDAQGQPLVLITANGVPHQLMGSAEFKLTEAEEQYRTPYERRGVGPLDEVLIVGAGSGSDVAIALSKGAGHVDAVDIDPRIMEIGDEHPDRPYQDPRVTAHVNDGRAFLKGTDKKYDLILFALPDSLALVNGASQIRLESFLFTKEAIDSVREHLNESGVFAMYNAYRAEWLVDRLGGTLEESFGHKPCVDMFASNQAVLTAAKDASNQICGPDNHEVPDDHVEAATDDSPFLYFRGGGIPPIYLLTLGGILLISLITVRALGGPFRQMRPYADLFFMGAAFLLLETKSIATFALLFGTTWLVNSLVFAGVLLVVLAAVETTRVFRTPPLRVIFGLVALSLAVSYVVQPAWLLSMPLAPRLIVATSLAFVPIYLANLAFSKRFAASDSSQAAFGINLLGAIVGGCLEYAALLTGYANLLIVVGLLYALAFLLTPKMLVNA